MTSIAARRPFLAQAPLIALAGLVLAAASDGLLWDHARRAFHVEMGQLEQLAPAWTGDCAIAVVAIVAGWLVERIGARPMSLAALVGLAIGCALLGLAGSSQVYRLARHVQLAAAVAALVGLAGWSLPAIEPRRRGLFLAVVSIAGYVGSKLVGVYAQMVVAETFGWRVYPLAFVAIVALAAVLAARRAVPADPIPRGIASVFDAEEGPSTPTSREQTTFATRHILSFGLGLVCAALLSNLSILVLRSSRPATGLAAEAIVGTAQILSVFGVALIATRVPPHRIGAACGLLLCLGCAALTGAVLLRVAMPPALARPEVRIVSNAAEFAFVLAVFRAGADALGRSAGLVVASMPIVWGLWQLMIMLVAETAFSPVAVDVIACAVAAIVVLVGVAGRDEGMSPGGA